MQNALIRRCVCAGLSLASAVLLLQIFARPLSAQQEPGTAKSPAETVAEKQAPAPAPPAAKTAPVTLSEPAAAKSEGEKPTEAEKPEGPEQVTTGIYALNVYNIDSSSSTFYLDFYVWFRWKGELDPTANLEFMNGIEDWGATKVPGYEKPEVLDDGFHYQFLRVESRFVQPFALDRYPLDQQKLTIQMEDSVHDVSALSYVVDTQNTGISKDLTIPGWKLLGHEIVAFTHKYDSNFGDPRITSSSFSAVRFDVKVARPISFFIWKLLLPLIIVLVASWGGLILNPRHVDSRILIPVTALLTTVFLQQSYSATLPDIGYLVLLDKIYALAYLLIMMTILWTVTSADRTDHRDAAGGTAVAKKDRLFLLGQVIVLVVGLALLILL